MLWSPKESRNTLKRLDYDSVNLQRVQFRPLLFNDDVVFKLFSIGDVDVQSQAKMMLGLDKRDDGHT